MQGVFDESPVVRYFGVKLSYCSQDEYPTYCKSLDEIKSYADGAIYYLDVINSYFDSDDYENPVKTYIDNRLYDYIDVGYCKLIDVYLTENTGNTRDSHLLMYDHPTEYSYINVDEIFRYFTSVDEYDLFFVGFYQSNKSQTFNRSTMNLIDIVALAGGFAFFMTIL